MCGGQSSEGFLVDHHLLLSKRRNDTELYWDIDITGVMEQDHNSRINRTFQVYSIMRKTSIAKPRGVSLKLLMAKVQ